MSESWILDHLHPLLSIDKVSLKTVSAWGGGLPATLDELEELRQTVGEIPADYLDLVAVHNGVCVRTTGMSGPSLYVSVLSCGDIIGWKTWYSFLAEEMPGCFFFAQDGDCSFLLGSHEGQSGVHRIETSIAMWQYAKYMAPSIRAMLCNGEGWANGELE